MANLPTYEEMGKKVAEKALDEYTYKGKTLREWVDVLKQTQWIPVSERLPEDNTTALVTFANGIVDTSEWRKSIKENNGFHFYMYEIKEGCYEKIGVIAWMPLPKPYEESEEAK